MPHYLGLVAPQVIYDERIKAAIECAYYEWRASWEMRQPEVPIENTRFEHDPDWRSRFFSIQSAHDGGHIVWKATKVIFGPMAGAV